MRSQILAKFVFLYTPEAGHTSCDSRKYSLIQNLKSQDKKANLVVIHCISQENQAILTKWSDIQFSEEKATTCPNGFEIFPAKQEKKSRHKSIPFHIFNCVKLLRCITHCPCCFSTGTRGGKNLAGIC
jgi:hypothetical protein